MLYITENAVRNIAQGLKTQTRRLQHNGDVAVMSDNAIIAVYSASGRLRYQVGKDYAVQDGRGQPGLLWYPHSIYDPAQPNVPLPDREKWVPFRTRILKIRDEDVRDISEADAIAEGFAGRFEFWQAWCGMYDPSALRAPATIADELWQILIERHDTPYQSWALNFEAVTA